VANPNESTRTPLPDPATATVPFAILNTDDLNAAAQTSLPWLWHGDFEEVEFTQSWQPLRLELEGAASRLTLQEIRKQWSGFEPPDEVTLWRWLKRAVGLGLVLRDGAGRRNDPFRYWLPGMEEKWRADPFSLEALGELGDLQAIPGVWPKVPRGKKERSQ